MVQLPTVSETETRDEFTATPAGDYALIDFGAGRKFERWGAYTVDRPDRLAQGKPREQRWAADWTWVGDAGQPGHWVAAREDLPREWTVRIGDQRVPCRLGAGGHIGLHGRDIPCAAWVRRRLEGCYDIEDLRVLNLFGGNGFVTAQALKAGATVVHVDAGEEMIALARATAGGRHVEYVRENVMDYVEELLRRQQRFDLIVLPVPPLGHGPRRQLWDREVDLPKLVRYLPRLITNGCLGIWLSTDGGAITWKAEGLGQLLREVLPGRTIEPLHLGVIAGDGRVLPAGVAARWYDDTDFLQEGGLPLTAAHLEERLDAHMVSLGAAEGPSRELAEFPRARQDFVLHWVGVIGRSSHGMAFNFLAHVCRALRLMEDAGVEAWLLHCMDIYDTRGLIPAVAAFKDVEAFARDYQSRSTGLAFDEVAGVLEAFVHGLNGRRLKVEGGEEIWTDTETLHLPASVSRFETRAANFLLFKAMVVHQWAQCWYGTWRVALPGALSRYADEAYALAAFHALETLRLDARLRTALPGLHRQMQALRDGTDQHMNDAWRRAADRLQQPNATVQDSVELLGSVIGSPLSPAAPYQGVLRPDAVEEVRRARLKADRQAFRLGLLRMKRQLDTAPPSERQTVEEGGETGEARPPFTLRKVPSEESPEGFTFEVELDGRPIAPPDDVKGTMASILQDLGDIPEDYLHAAGEGAYFPGETGARAAEDVWKGTYHEEGAFLYNEWDYERQHYRKNWAVLRELEVSPLHDDFAARTLVKYRGLAANLRRTFEALRGEDRLLKRQPDGENIDIDALVEAWADATLGREMPERLFTKRHKLERNIAVMFMVDMSGSTKGWINEAEREALLLLCESLETLGDRYAIYGFSGTTRKRCEVYRIKGFEEPYGEEVRARIGGITPRDYTRMGVTIRHLTRLLNEVEARTKLLVTLSDGKPDDYDGYRGAYGIEDTRQALIEARRCGIHVFCITIDTEARDYLPHMYGAVNYAVIDEVRKLPLRVSDIYRRLTR